MEKNVLINHTTGKEYVLKDLGDVSVPASLWVYWAVGCQPRGLRQLGCHTQQSGKSKSRETLSVLRPSQASVSHVCPQGPG